MKLKDIVNKKLYSYIINDKKITAVLLFGSMARGEKYRDTDICIILDKKYDHLIMARKRVKYSSLATNKIDIQIFQQLPIYIRKRILKEGKILLCNNEDRLYDIAFATLKEFEFYKKIYYTYLKSMETAK